MPCAPSSSTRRPAASAALRERLRPFVTDTGVELRAALADGVEGERRLAEQRLEIGVLLAQVALEGLAEAGLVEQVADADAGARHLVLVGRTDAAPRRPDVPRAAQALARPVDGTMVGHDEVGLLADAQPAVLRQVAPLAQRLDLAH